MKIFGRRVGIATGRVMAAALLSAASSPAASEKTDKHKAAPPFDPPL